MSSFRPRFSLGEKVVDIDTGKTGVITTLSIYIDEHTKRPAVLYELDNVAFRSKVWEIFKLGKEICSEKEYMEMEMEDGQQ